MIDSENTSEAKLNERNNAANKNRTCVLRLSQKDEQLLNFKSKLIGTDKSKLLRDSMYANWGESGYEKHIEDLQELYEKNKELVVQLIIEYLRQKGYPHRKLNKLQLKKEMHKIVNTKNPLLEDNHLQSNTVGLAIANFFHPHMVKVKCMKNYYSPYEVFSTDSLLYDAIKRWFDLGYKPSWSGIRRILRTRDGVRSVVNFKPAVAKYIYETYTPKDGTVLDPCAGYGGRLTGLIAANKNLLYEGIDPCPQTAVGNTRLAAFYSGQYEGLSNKPIWSFRFKFDLGCAEDVMPNLPESSYDLVFTSPPYHDQEKYDILPTQSYLRYPEYNIWRDKFLFAIISESYRVCKTNGYVILNVKNYKNKEIASDTIKLTEQVGLKLIKAYNMRLSNSEYNRIEGKKMFHIEPILVFQKNKN